jgi:chaperonin cofactor prefoldin
MVLINDNNRVVATVNALVNDVKLIQTDNVVVIDTTNTRIGVKTANPQYEIDVSGDINVTGNIFQGGSLLSSDQRLKHDIIDISNGLEIINQLNPKFYKKTKNLNAIDNSKEPYILEAGLIAQEIFQINDLSYTVLQGTQTTPFYLNYNNIFVYALSAIKQLNEKINYLEKKINILENKET